MYYSYVTYVRIYETYVRIRRRHTRNTAKDVKIDIANSKLVIMNAPIYTYIRSIIAVSIRPKAGRDFFTILPALFVYAREKFQFYVPNRFAPAFIRLRWLRDSAQFDSPRMVKFRVRVRFIITVAPCKGMETNQL